MCKCANSCAHITPFIQADQIRECCCAPSFIVTIAGPWFCVLGGIFLNRIVVQPLTALIPLTIDIRNKDQVYQIARIFQALLMAFQQLRNFYRSLNLDQTGQRFFPYLRSFRPDRNSIVNFTYTEELAEDHTRAIWKARTDSGDMIVVKFVTEYNMNAHIICWKRGYAPKLLYQSFHGEIRALGGYMMIVMEYVGISLDKKLDKIEINPQNSIYSDIEFAIGLLHSKNYVFADLRPPNILVYDEHGKQRAMLIDFDWCGRHNTDRYPPNLNKSIPWPTNVKPTSCLDKEHDLYWLRKLKECLQ